GTQYTAYPNTPVNATGGAAPLTWSIASGALPTGLSIASATGIISGTPTVTGPYTFTVRVTDQNGATATSQSFTVTISAGVGPGWFTGGNGAGWQHRKSITIRGAQIAGTLSNFPVLVSLPGDTDLANLSGNTQVAFTDSNGTSLLSYEIESFTSTSGSGTL